MRRQLLLDTNHASDLIAPSPRLFDRFLAEHRRRVVFGICIPVLCEIEAGIRNSPRPEPSRRQLTRFLKMARVWPIDIQTARIFGDVYVEARKQGRAISQVDLMVAAYCRQRRMTLLTADQDFAAFPDLRIENWLA